MNEFWWSPRLVASTTSSRCQDTLISQVLLLRQISRCSSNLPMICFWKSLPLRMSYHAEGSPQHRSEVTCVYLLFSVSCYEAYSELACFQLAQKENAANAPDWLTDSSSIPAAFPTLLGFCWDSTFNRWEDAKRKWVITRIWFCAVHQEWT